RPMLVLGRARLGREVRWVEGDALRLPFPDGFFDAVVSAFLLRNVVNVRAALVEQTRVVRPGGRVVCLEMTWPRHPLFRPLFHLYFGGLAPLLGWLLTGCLDEYRYLPRSVRAFLSPEELASLMEDVGLREVRYRLLMLGTVTLHVGTGG
ncbi:MAG: methyltransferase domain-containing protein, partial [Thermoflexia bacterium]